ncbi:hypothetical protein NQZ79_g5751 [Umbelopsis isabellina]|nr:hypothetical protein NQZ79_g5751 [Umbelopsis isabellina]
MSEQKEEVFDFPDIELEERDLKPEEYTCNATQAFDAVFQCYSEWQLNANFFSSQCNSQSPTLNLYVALGAQALNYYRYGEKKDCSVKWDDFKLCLSTKTKSPLAAKKLLDDRKKEKESQKQIQRSSEDVWTLREIPQTDTATSV